MSTERSTIDTAASGGSADGAGNGATPDQGTLTVTDNRTGATYELPITDGTCGRSTCDRSRPTSTTSG